MNKYFLVAIGILFSSMGDCTPLEEAHKIWAGIMRADSDAREALIQEVSTYDEEVRHELLKIASMEKEGFFEIRIASQFHPLFESFSRPFCVVDSYAFAVYLRPHVGKGDKIVDYYYGRALKNSAEYSPENFMEGLYWMDSSLGLSVVYPQPGEDFEMFKQRYIGSVDTKHTYLDEYGFRFVGPSTILAPSPKSVRAFRERLRAVSLSPPENFVFNHDFKQLREILGKYKFFFSGISSFFYGVGTEELIIAMARAERGQIRVNHHAWTVHSTFSDEDIQPVIDFAQEVIARAKSAHQAARWLLQLLEGDWDIVIG